MSRRNSLSSTSSFQSQSPSMRDISTSSLLAIDTKFVKRSVNQKKNGLTKSPVNQTYYFPNGEVFRPRDPTHQKRCRPDKLRPSESSPSLSSKRSSSSLPSQTLSDISHQGMPHPHMSYSFSATERSGSYENLPRVSSLNDMRPMSINTNIPTGPNKYVNGRHNGRSSNNSSPQASPLHTSPPHMFPRTSSAPNFNNYRYKSNARTIPRNSSLTNVRNNFGDQKFQNKQNFINSVRQGTVLNINELSQNSNLESPASPQLKMHCNNVIKSEPTIGGSSTDSCQNGSLQSLPEKGSSSISSTSSGYSMTSSSSGTQNNKPQTGLLNRSLSNTPTTSISTNDTKDKDVNQDVKSQDTNDQFGKPYVPGKGDKPDPRVTALNDTPYVPTLDSIDSSEISSTETSQNLPSSEMKLITEAECETVTEMEIQPNENAAEDSANEDTDKPSPVGNDSSNSSYSDSNQQFRDNRVPINETRTSHGIENTKDNATRTELPTNPINSPNQPKQPDFRMKTEETRDSSVYVKESDTSQVELKKSAEIPSTRVQRNGFVSNNSQSASVYSDNRQIKNHKSMPNLSSSYASTNNSEVKPARQSKSKFKSFFRKLFSKKNSKRQSNLETEASVATTQRSDLSGNKQTIQNNLKSSTTIPIIENTANDNTKTTCKNQNDEPLTVTRLPSIRRSGNSKLMADFMSQFDRLDKELSQDMNTNHTHTQGNIRKDIFMKDDELSLAQIQDQKLKDSTLPQSSSSSSLDDYVDDNILSVREECNWEGYQDAEIGELQAYVTIDGKELEDDRVSQATIVADPNDDNSRTGKIEVIFSQEQLEQAFRANEQKKKLPAELKYVKQFKDFDSVKVDYRKFEELDGNNNLRQPETTTGSIMKQTSCNENKKVKFSNNININETFAPDMYKRYNKCVTQYTLTEPTEINRIKVELNNYKSHEMLVHEQSLDNTHFFYR